MKKIIAAILILTLALSGCSPKQASGSSEPEQIQATTQPSATQEATPTQEPTPTAEPAPTPDADPAAKLMVSNEEFEKLLELWPSVSSPLSDHGTITRFSMNSQYGIQSATLNFLFESEKPEDELFAFYQELVVGDWEDSEYSAGPSVYGGLIEDKIETTCQVATVEGKQEVFMGMYIDAGGEELDALFDAHWPVGLIELHENLSDESKFFKYFEYKPGVSLSFSQSWNTESEEVVSEVLAYYKDLLAGEEGYEYSEGGEYESAYVACTLSGISVKVAESMDTRIEITLAEDIE